MTNVVCANKSEHNPQPCVPKTLAKSMPENRSSLALYVRIRTRTTFSPSTTSRSPENCQFSGLPQPARLGRVHIHAMHRTDSTLVGSGCPNVHRGSARFGGVADPEAAVEPPRRDARLLFPYLHDQAKAPVGTPTTTGDCSSSAIFGGEPADSHSIRTSGAGVLGGPMAARDTDNNLGVSVFI